MKRTYFVLVMCGITAFVGCNQGKPGGPGATNNSTSMRQADDTFNLSVPVVTSSLQQGEKTEATVGIKRANNFDEDVTLKFSDVPKGVTIEPAAVLIKHGDSNAKIVITATDEATLGDFNLKVVGHPTKGSDAEVGFKLTIAPKDSFTLNMPRSATEIKQGATQTMAIGINRDKGFDQDVALTFGDLPTGVTLEPKAPVIKMGAAETQLTIKTLDTASLGNFDIKVVGQPGKGVSSSNAFKLVVAK